MKVRTMRYVAPRSIELYGAKVAPPGNGQVQVKKKACGLCAADVYVFAHGPGSTPWGPPGHEAVGVITEVGPGVTQWKKGDKVAGGGFAEVENLDASWLIKLPDDVSDFALWVAEPVACVVNGLDQAAVRAGERVALVGAGFMGLLLVEGLMRSPCGELVVMDVDERRLEVARVFGVKHAVNLSAPQGQNQLQTLDNSIDVVIDSTGVQAGLDRSTALVRSGGKIVLFGWVHGTATFNGDTWHMKGITIINGSPMSSLDMRSCWKRAVVGLKSGLFDLKPLVTHRGSLEDLPQILAAGADKTGGYIKGVVCYD